jgi:peptidoglycan/LPS O-acetylase OafA/YrhL
MPAKLPSHIPALDGLRGVAVTLVVLHNLRQITEPLPGQAASLLWVQLLDRGWIGVQLFFVLSGFLITRILLRSREAKNYYSGFFARRALRILPLYYAALLLWLVVLPAIGWGYPHDDRQDFYLWVFLSNWVQPFHSNGALVHFWSLAVEEQFYFVWPFLLRRFAALPFCLTVAALSLAVRIAMLAAGFISEAVYEWTPCRMDALALGGAVAALGENPRWRLPSWSPWVVLALGAAVSRGYRQTGTLAQTAGYSLLALGFAWWVFALVSEGQSRWLEWPWLRSLGKYSYGIYVIHLPFRVVAEWALHRLGKPLTLGVDICFVLVTFAVVYGLAVVCYHAFEARFLRLKSRFEPVS